LNAAITSCRPHSAIAIFIATGVIRPLSSGDYGFPDGLRQCDRAKEHLWIQIILAGFVDDPKQAVLLGGRVAERDVDLPLLKRCRVALIIDGRDQAVLTATLP
jgi:hypothetical protein